MTTIWGFYRCPNPLCERMHAYDGGFTLVHCVCGAVIDEIDLTWVIR